MESREDLQQIVSENDRMSLEINVDKSKILVVGMDQRTFGQKVQLDGMERER